MELLKRPLTYFIWKELSQYDQQKIILCISKEVNSLVRSWPWTWMSVQIITFDSSMQLDKG